MLRMSLLVILLTELGDLLGHKENYHYSINENREMVHMKMKLLRSPVKYPVLVLPSWVSGLVDYN